MFININPKANFKPSGQHTVGHSAWQRGKNSCSEEFQKLPCRDFTQLGQ